FGRKISDRQYMLTPKEIEVCALIRIGLSNKEIASRLFLSVETVEKHRKNIRRKLGLVGKGINLQTHLTDFQ
ncbi:MAG TPA: helix-turn-helix transcriptional regulator, partial [Thermodesulfovibrionales bacterium]|nr:helix-turn-helix transcriptional regulator [Thermodesulfovibrionales bacterium]